MIRCGYRLPFAQYPSQCFLNNRSALQHPEFVAEAIIELLSNGCIVEHVLPPFCVNRGRKEVASCYFSFRDLARIAGSIISVALAVGPISRLLTRQMYFAIETRSAWVNAIQFSLSLLLELKFRYCNIDCSNGYSIRPPLRTKINFCFPTLVTQDSEVIQLL